MQYVIHRRIGEAQTLLMYTHIPIHMIEEQMVIRDRMQIGLTGDRIFTEKGNMVIIAEFRENFYGFKEMKKFFIAAREYMNVISMVEKSGKPPTCVYGIWQHTKTCLLYTSRCV